MISPEILRRYPCFGGIREDTLKKIAGIGEERTAKAGTVIFRENDPADHLYVVTSGEVEIRCLLGSGEQRTVDTVVGGELLAWSAVVEPHRLTATGVATKDVRLVVIEAARLRKLCQDDPHLGYHLMSGIARVISERLAGARVQLATMG